MRLVKCRRTAHTPLTTSKPLVSPKHIPNKRCVAQVGKKEDLVMRLAAVLELEAAEASDVLTELRFVGQDISPVVVTPSYP